MSNAPGKAFREGISLLELMDLFPTEEAAIEWFEAQIWPDGRICPRCGHDETSDVPNTKPMLIGAGIAEATSACGRAPLLRDRRFP